MYRAIRFSILPIDYIHASINLHTSLYFLAKICLNQDDGQLAVARSLQEGRQEGDDPPQLQRQPLPACLRDQPEQKLPPPPSEHHGSPRPPDGLCRAQYRSSQPPWLIGQTEVPAEDIELRAVRGRGRGREGRAIHLELLLADSDGEAGLSGAQVPQRQQLRFWILPVNRIHFLNLEAGIGSTAGQSLISWTAYFMGQQGARCGGEDDELSDVNSPFYSIYLIWRASF